MARNLQPRKDLPPIRQPPKKGRPSVGQRTKMAQRGNPRHRKGAKLRPWPYHRAPELHTIGGHHPHPNTRGYVIAPCAGSIRRLPFLPHSTFGNTSPSPSRGVGVGILRFLPQNDKGLIGIQTSKKITVQVNHDTGKMFGAGASSPARA